MRLQPFYFSWCLLEVEPFLSKSFLFCLTAPFLVHWPEEQTFPWALLSESIGISGLVASPITSLG